MNTEMTGIIASFLITVLLAFPLGKYIAKVFNGERTFTDFMKPLERLIYRICGINPEGEMDWKQFLKAMLTINLLWFAYAFFMFLYQAHLPLNPDGNPDMTPDLSFNSAISFLTNTNWQNYSGETGVTYLTQLFVITFLQFVSAATGIACLVGLFNGLKHKTTNNLGNFWSIFIKSITRILLPLSIVIAVLLAFNGTPASYDGKDSVITLQGDTVQVSRGPAAGMIAIKHLGTNGGGWFNANSAHPFENPTPLTNVIEFLLMASIPTSLLAMLAVMLGKRRQAWTFFSVMAGFFLVFLVIAYVAETGGNPLLTAQGLDQSQGNLEGHELRFG